MGVAPEQVIVVVDGRVHDAEDAFEAAYINRRAQSPVTILPIGRWVHHLASEQEGMPATA